MADVGIILGTIDARIGASMETINSIQEGYRNDNGRYAQAMFTHSEAPEDENESSPDQLESHPTDQVSSWADLAQGVMPDTMLSRMKIDSYDGPRGQGYVIFLEKKINGQLYVKSINVGPEEERSKDWTIGG